MVEQTMSTKLVYLPSFDGMAKLFQMQWLRFMAYASVFGFTQNIQGRVDLDLPAMKDTMIDETDSTASGKKSNTIATASFTIALTSEPFIGIVYMAMTTDCPIRLAYKIMAALHKKYTIKDMRSRLRNCYNHKLVPDQRKGAS
eukprot:15341016-Ditylum_brightwellii.AAC.2